MIVQNYDEDNKIVIFKRKRKEVLEYQLDVNLLIVASCLKMFLGQ